MSDVSVPPIWELDYLNDFTLYQHPPCMFTLWYLGLLVNACWDPVKDLINKLLDGGGDGGDSGGGKDKGGDDEGGKGGEETRDAEGEAAEGADEAPAEQAPAEEEPAEEEG